MSQIHIRIADLARETQARSGNNAESAIKELTEHAVEEIPGAAYAGITVTKGRLVQSAAATHRYPVLLDEIQQRYRQGPCVTAAWEHHTVRVPDIRSDHRWPAYREEVLQQTPIRSILSFQLFTATHSMGALNLFSEIPHALDDPATEEIGIVFAAHAALAWDAMRREESFASALASRDIIGQAKGIVMERYGIDAVAAFDLLRRLSQESNTPVVDLARQLATLGRPD